jgi:hypothetical protein
MIKPIIIAVIPAKKQLRGNVFDETNFHDNWVNKINFFNSRI